MLWHLHLQAPRHWHHFWQRMLLAWLTSGMLQPEDEYRHSQGSNLSQNSTSREYHYPFVDHCEKDMDTLGFAPRAFRMRSGCDTTTPCALGGGILHAGQLRWLCTDGVARQMCHTPGQD